ncbi:MAG TPA: DISARM system phospholipase D-like protein DrmC [Blastocatellia bacterium]|nr:DISARM system phospholipase D-like protein DrmC [Blastocatellia bacterium]
MSQLNVHKTLAEEAHKLTRALPMPVVEVVLDALAQFDTEDWATSRTRTLARIAQPNYRTLVGRFLDTWRADAWDLNPQSITLALMVGAEAERISQEGQTMELVWTGPDISLNPVRQTEQALLQIVESATRRLIVVSYAVHNIPRICDALVRAAARGVLIKVVVETPDRMEGQNTYNTLRALGPEVARTCNMFFWPREKRETDSAGRPGILHVKCAIADGHWLFLSSANLTEYAFTLNMELGFLIRGGPMPERVESRFERLIQLGVLARV